jgi:hypothetical protein
MWGVGRNLLLGFLVAQALSACGSGKSDGTEGVSSSTGIHPRKASPANQAMMRDMTGALAGNRTSVPVQVRFHLRERPDIGQPVDVDLAIVPAAEIDRVSGQVQTDDGLDLISGAQIPPTDRPAQGSPIAHSLKVLPKRDGIFTFNVVLSVEYAGQNVTQTYSMPIIAGSGITGLPASDPKASKTSSTVPAAAKH